MAGGKKRGASTSRFDDSGRGGKRSAGGTSSPCSSGSGRGSSGKDRLKVDSATKKLNGALYNAYMLSNACKQATKADVWNIRWELKTDKNGIIQSSYAGFKNVLDGRRKFFKNVMSLLIKGVVVTQPTSNETYHTVDIVVDGKVVLQLLFRHSDGYLVAFRLVSTKDIIVWEGWYHFSDISLPSFCVEKAKLGWNSSYSDVLQVRFGKGIISNIINCLREFTPENCTAETYGPHNRVVLIETLMVFLGECERSGVFLKFAEQNYESQILVHVTEELKKHLHSWSNLSKAVMALYLGYLQQDHGQNGWQDKVSYGEGQIAREIGEFRGLGSSFGILE